MARLQLAVEQLDKFRQSQGWSQAELARQMAIESSMLFKLMRGERSPGEKVVAGLCKISGQAIPFCVIQDDGKEVTA